MLDCDEAIREATRTLRCTIADLTARNEMLERMLDDAIALAREVAVRLSMCQGEVRRLEHNQRTLVGLINEKPPEDACVDTVHWTVDQLMSALNIPSTVEHHGQSYSVAVDRDVLQRVVNMKNAGDRERTVSDIIRYLKGGQRALSAAQKRTGHSGAKTLHLGSLTLSSWRERAGPQAWVLHITLA